MTMPIEFAPALSRSIDPDGAARFVVDGDVGMRQVYALSAHLTRDLLEGHRSFVLDLTHAGEIDPRLWPKLTDWSWKLQHVDRNTGPAPRFWFDGVSPAHRASIDAEKLSNLYSVRGVNA